MKNTITKLEKSKFQLDVEVEEAAWKAAQEKAFRKLASKIVLPGFRPGKAPEAMLRQRVDFNQVINNALDDILNPAFVQALEEAKIYVQSNRLTGTISDRAITVNHIGDDPSETFQVREYHPGDQISRTHWKLTAKRDILMTRDFAKESDSQYLFVLSFTKNTQECFHKVLTNYYSLAFQLLSEETNHMVLWADDEGSVWDGFVNSEDDLENVLLMISHSFDVSKFDKATLSERTALSPVSGEVILEEFLEKTPGSSFIKQFIITDESLDVLQGRWSEDEE